MTKDVAILANMLLKENYVIHVQNTLMLVNKITKLRCGGQNTFRRWSQCVSIGINSVLSGAYVAPLFLYLVLAEGGEKQIG